MDLVIHSETKNRLSAVVTQRLDGIVSLLIVNTDDIIPFDDVVGIKHGNDRNRRGRGLKTKRSPKGDGK